jgi:hypothetical protein
LGKQAFELWESVADYTSECGDSEIICIALLQFRSAQEIGYYTRQPPEIDRKNESDTL